MLTVKIVRVPGAVTEVALNDDATVADALEAGNIALSTNEGLSVNGNPAENDTALSDGDRVVVAKASKSAA